MKVSKKKLLNWIEEQAEKLPPEMYVAYHRNNVSKQEVNDILLKTGSAREAMNATISPEEHLVNHKRRMYSAFKASGLPGIQSYLAKRGFEIKMTQ